MRDKGKTEIYKCPVCLFELWNPIVPLTVSWLGLYNDARFPGRCILVLNEHAEDFASLNANLAQSFIYDTQLAARAIRSITKAPRINYALLGNQLSHIHFHLIPRGLPGDPIPTRTPWEHPDYKSELSHLDVERMVRQLQSALASVVG